MNSDYPVMLDACVLLPMPLADTLLRMAETPRLYLPRWSDETLTEISRNLIQKWSKTPEQAARRETAMREWFPESLISGYGHLLASMTNDAKDKHVLAAAVISSTKLIVTYNSNHFPKESLEPYEIECQGPSTFLIGLYDLEPGVVVQKLSEQAQNIGLSLEQLMLRLRINVPGFVSFFCEEQEINLPISN
jgi:predicted nucleic acid-binding protein